MRVEAVKKPGRAGRRLPPGVTELADVIAVQGKQTVGESQSNGRAERAVQAVENVLRVHQLALEARTETRICSKHPLFR